MSNTININCSRCNSAAHAALPPPGTSLTRVYSTPTTGSLTRPAGALYAPFASESMAMLGTSFNVSRHAVGKPLYPLIARNDQECDVLRQWLHHEIIETTAALEAITPVIQLAQDKDDLAIAKFGRSNFKDVVSRAEQLQLRLDTLRQMKIISNQDKQELASLQPETDKLYLLGYGYPGESHLAAGSWPHGSVTSAELANQLASGGLNPAFKDFRAATPYSADVQEPRSFGAKDLKRAARAPVEKDYVWRFLFFIMRVSQSNGQAGPFAQTFCNALKNAGFTQPQVSGYHGARSPYSTNHHYCRLPGMPKEVVRASSVRKVFTPTV